MKNSHVLKKLHRQLVQADDFLTDAGSPEELESIPVLLYDLLEEIENVYEELEGKKL